MPRLPLPIAYTVSIRSKDELQGRSREVSVIVVYIVVLLFVFFAASFIVARYSNDGPTDTPNFILLVGASLAWPISVPLTAAILLLFYVAKLADRLSGGAK